MPSFPTLLPIGRRGWIAALALSLTALVQAQTDGARKWAFATVSSFVAGNILSSPAVAPDGTLYIGVEVGATGSAAAGRLFAISPSGAAKWSTPFATTDWIDATPTIAPDGTIYFGCWDGKLYALRPDGTQKWAAALGSYISASAALGSDGTIYVGTGDGNLCAVNPTDGSLKWLFPTLYWIDAAPAVAPDGTIYIGSLDNTFYAVGPDGKEKWHYGVANDIASSPAIGADGTVYFGSRDLNFYALNPNGALKWKFTTTDMIDASPVIGADGTIYIATTGGRIFALRPDGTTKWQYPAAGQTGLSSLYSTPTLRADGSIVFGTSDNFLYALKSDGTLLWRSSVGDWTDSSAVIAPDGTIYIGCTDKKIYAFTGTVLQNMTDWPALLRSPQRTGIQPLGAATGTTGRLSNLSVRTMAGSGDSTLIVGFSLSGSGTRSLLVRGVGPTLTNYGVTGVLADPFMSIIPLGSSTVTASNDNWADTNGNAISAAGNALGAFPLGNLDAAILNNFSVGQGQTVSISGHNGGTGIALVELYDNNGSSSARLSNVSARSFVDVGAGVLTAGFVVVDSTRAVLIRGIGPTLATYGVSGVVAQPQLRLYNISNNQQVVVADSIGWTNATNATAMAAAAKAVGGFDLAAGSKDSAMLVTLPPGNYSAQVSGVNSTTGNGMVEVYEVP